MVNFRTQKSPSVQTGSAERNVFRNGTTHLAKIAVVLQEAPYKMLTFSQLMSKLAPLFSEDRKSMESNIRVCLSGYKCFVKIPMVPGSHDSKKNYWKLDTHQITEKMVRRHFKGILELFPELASKVKAEPPSRASKQVPAVKFSGPFSIESLLKSASVSPEKPRACPPPQVVFKEQQQEQPGPSHSGRMMSFGCWGPEALLVPVSSSGSSFMWPAGGSTYRGFAAAGFEDPIGQMYRCTEAPFPVYTGADPGPSFTGPHCSYITYPEPKPTYLPAHGFWM